MWISASQYCKFFLLRYIGVFAWQGFGSGGAIGWVSARSCEKLPPCLIKPVPAGSKTDPLPAKAKPISNGGSASVTTYLRRGKKSGSKTAVEREKWDNVKETTLQTQRPVKKEGKEVLKMPEQRAFPCSSWWRPWWGRLSSCSPWRSMVEQISTCSLWKRPCAGAGRCLKEAVTQWGAPRWLLPGPADEWREEPMLEQVSWQGWWPHGGPTLEQSVPEGLHPVGRTHVGVVREELHPVGRAHMEKSVENCLPWEGPHTGTGAECEESSPWGERSGRDNVWSTDHNLHSPSPCTTWGGEEVGNSGVKLSLGRREGWGEGVWRFAFISYYPTLIWLVMNLIPFSLQIQSVLSVTVIGEWSLPVLISTLEPFIIFPLPCPVEEGKW